MRVTQKEVVRAVDAVFKFAPREIDLQELSAFVAAYLYLSKAPTGEWNLISDRKLGFISNEGDTIHRSKKAVWHYTIYYDEKPLVMRFRSLPALMEVLCPTLETIQARGYSN